MHDPDVDTPGTASFHEMSPTQSEQSNASISTQTKHRQEQKISLYERHFNLNKESSNKVSEAVSMFICCT